MRDGGVGEGAFINLLIIYLFLFSYFILYFLFFIRGHSRSLVVIRGHSWPLVCSFSQNLFYHHGIPLPSDITPADHSFTLATHLYICENHPFL